MEIKKRLKALDVKISKLATELGVSRPTLDNYIDCYEKGVAIPNEAYQKIFEYLFSSESMTSIEFAQKYDYVKRVMLKEVKEGVEKGFEETRENLLIEKICTQLNENVANKPLLEFINLFISNQNIELVKAIYMYFNFTNGFSDMKEMILTDRDKALFSNFAKLFEDYNENNVEFLDKYFVQVKEKNQKLFAKKKVKVTDTDIIDYIKNNLSNDKNIDIEVIKKMLESRED